MTSRAGRWLALVALSALALVVALTLDSSGAEAHALRLRSVPEQNQQLQNAPERVEIWFTETIEQDAALTGIEVLDSAANRVDEGPTRFSDDPVYASVGLKPDLGPGVYTVVWRNLSTVDGHRFQGFFPFVVLNPDGSVPEGAALVSVSGGTGAGLLPSWGDIAFRWLGLLAAAAIPGAALFLLVVFTPAIAFVPAEEKRRLTAASTLVLARTAYVAALVLALAAIGELALQVNQFGGLSALDNVVFDSRTGRLWLARQGLALVAGGLAVGLVVARGRLRAPAIPGALALVGASILMLFSMRSHASAQGGEFWATAADFLHFLALGGWLGVLAPLALTWPILQRRLSSDERLVVTANVFDRFSALAVASVALVLISGVFNALVQLPTLESLRDTTYGRVLIAKLVLVALLLGVAAINAALLKPALVDAIDEYDDAVAEGEEAETRRPPERLEQLRRVLPRTILMELGLGAAVLVSVAVLGLTVTARSEATQAEFARRTEQEQAFEGNEINEDLAVELEISPRVIGINTYDVHLSSVAGELGDVAGVNLRFFYNDPRFGQTAAEAQVASSDPAAGVESWTLEGAFFSIGGDWRIQVDVARRGRDDVRSIFPLAVGSPPEKRPGLFDLPFDATSGDVVAAAALVIGALGMLTWQRQLGVLAPRLARAALPVAMLALVGAVAVVGTAAVRGDGDSTSANPIELTDESVAIGQQLFVRNCALCHGDTGRGDGPAGAGLNPPPADFEVHVPFHSDGQLWEWITNGVPGSAMPAFLSELDDEQRWHLVNFLRATFDEEAPPVGLSTPTPLPGSASARENSGDSP